MATPFFGKREEAPAPSRSSSATSYANSIPSPASPPSILQPGAIRDAAFTGTEGSKLTVGLNIKLKGVEITDCDTLVVEGLVEATMNSRVMQISEQGAFKGAAEIDLAEIRGVFEGSLTVRQKLVIYASGKVTGTIRYGKLVVEEGAQLSGDIAFGTQSQSSKPPALAKPESPTVA
jgi:cytoskeletal protein CcmA (bactofilin family)